MIDREELIAILQKGNGLEPIKAVNRLLRKDESLTELVIEEALNPESPVGKNAVWTLEYLTRRKRRTVKPHLQRIISEIPKLTDPRQQALFLRMLAHFRLTLDEIGPLINFLIECLRKREEVSYYPYYSMQIMEQIIRKEPYFAREFHLAAKEAYPLYTKFYVKRKADLFLAKCKKAMDRIGESVD